MANRVEVIVWKDVLILSDDGRSVVSDYDELFEIAAELTAKHPHGWGLITIIPANAVPPSEPVRQAINQALQRSQHMLRGASWCIEGAGFQSAMVRAVLTGLRFLTNAPYARNHAHSLEESLQWLLPRLEGGERRLEDCSQALSFVSSRRAAMSRLQTVKRETAAKAASSAE